MVFCETVKTVQILGTKKCVGVCKKFDVRTVHYQHWQACVMNHVATDITFQALSSPVKHCHSIQDKVPAGALVLGK